MSLPDYFNRFNPDLLSLIPPDAKTVLEIGCGAGALCAAYRRINPGVEWHGFDADAEAIKVASTRMESADVGDIEDGHGYAYFDVDHEDWYDVLVLGDILEHLRQPWAQLKRLAAYVRPGAQVLASIPNVQHWTIIRDLLNGKWDYADEGLMDRTHLRFFTRKTIKEMFAAAGLQVFEMRGRDLCNDGFDDFIESRLGENRDKPWSRDYRELKAYQYIVRAVKPKIEPVMGYDNRIGVFFGVNERQQPEHLRVHAVTAEECCARPRILEPFAMMGTEPGVKCTMGDKLVGKPDIIVQQRFRDFKCLAQELLIEDGHILIAELDDDPDGLEGYAENDYRQLRAVHAVQVSTEPLAEIVRRYNPNVMVLPNQIAELPPPREFAPSDCVHIFYGAQNRQSDWAPIMAALNRVIEEYHSKLWFTVVHDREFYDALDTMQKSFSPFCEYERYRALLRKCDIALLPLEPGRFNECKSDIKFLECAAEGVAVLAGQTVYFETLFTNGPIPLGMFYDSQFCGDGKFVSSGDGSDEFENGLRFLITDTSWRQKYAEAAYAYVRDNRLLSQHYRTQLEWYRSLLRSKAALHRDLLERVPALRPLQRDLAETHPLSV